MHTCLKKACFRKTALNIIKISETLIYLVQVTFGPNFSIFPTSTNRMQSKKFKLFKSDTGK